MPRVGRAKVWKVGKNTLLSSMLSISLANAVGNSTEVAEVFPVLAVQRLDWKANACILQGQQLVHTILACMARKPLRHLTCI